jgi:hypothetical protein
VNALFEAATEVQEFCSGNGWHSAIIGGLAVQRWGEPRQTRDVDLALLTGLGNEALFVDALLQRYTPRRKDARQFALERRVLLISTEAGIPLDLSLAALPFEERLIARASAFAFAPAAVVATCSAEDLVVLKAFADRPQDWIDIEGVLVRQGRALNRSAILEELTPLLELKEDVEPESRLRKLFQRHP